MNKRTVLIPLDGSDFGAQIVQPILDLMSPAHHAIVLLHVCPPPEPHPVPVPADALPDSGAAATVPQSVRMHWETVTDADVEAATNAALQQMEPARAQFEAAGFEVRAEVAFGLPAAAIERITNDGGVDLVAMTTHGRSGLSRMIAGSVAGHVLRHVYVPVLMLRPAVAADPYTYEELIRYF